ncbi:MAG: hypothetical protein HRT56_07970 [Coraliomargarita sp.]|nr:hypothetical protein [Coraliomargarita sp.]
MRLKFGVRGVASSVTHLDALLGWRLALLQILRSPVCLYFMEMLSSGCSVISL